MGGCCKAEGEDHGNRTIAHQRSGSDYSKKSNYEVTQDLIIPDDSSATKPSDALEDGWWNQGIYKHTTLMAQATLKRSGPFKPDPNWTNNKQQKRRMIQFGQEFYEGSWDKESNVKEGYGVQVFDDQRVFEGRWINGEPSDKGRMTYPNGAQFLGDYSFGIRNGEGRYENPDGSYYDGSW